MKISKELLYKLTDEGLNTKQISEQINVNYDHIKYAYKKYNILPNKATRRRNLYDLSAIYDSNNINDEQRKKYNRPLIHIK